MMQSTNPTGAGYLRTLVARGAGASRSGDFSLESLAGAGDQPAGPHPDDVLARVDATMRKLPVDEIGDPDEFRRALTVFLQQAEHTLRKMDDPLAPLDDADAFTLEAVVRTDGTRPSLLIRDNEVDVQHPLATEWQDTLFLAKDIIRDCAKSVGRIEPANPTARNFFGTGWVVSHLDADRALILTNDHVIHAMRQGLPAGSMTEDNGAFAVRDGAAFIDFAAESGSLAQRRFKVVTAKPSPVPGAGFSLFDAAALVITRVDGDSSPFPDPIPVIADTDGPVGNLASFCVIGYPGPPKMQSGVQGTVDWGWITNTLFGAKFGVKRLAPGIAHRTLGSFTGDPRRWIFGHDATTLGGSSGSPIIGWLGGRGSFGLHFAGTTVDTNCAHAVAQCRAELEQLGVRIVGTT